MACRYRDRQQLFGPVDRRHLDCHGRRTHIEGSHTIGSDMEAKFRIEGQDLTPEDRTSAYNKNMTEDG